MKNLYAHCLAYNSLDFVFTAIKRFEEQKGEYPIKQKLLVDPAYPLTGKRTQAEFSEELKEIAAKFGWEYLKISNKGTSNNWNAVSDYLRIGDGDVLFGCDPDARPVQPKYLDAMMRVFNGDSSAYTVQLNTAGVYVMGLPRDEFEVNGEPVIAYKQLVAWPCGAFDGGWLRRIGGLAQRHGSYGYIEHETSAKAEPLGGRFLMLRDYYDDHQKAEHPEYTAWKLACAQFQTSLPFDEWLRHR